MKDNRIMRKATERQSDWVQSECTASFALRNFKFQIGPINCCICHSLYRRLPKYNEEMKEMTKKEIEDSFGKFCKNCENWFCQDCMHLNYKAQSVCTAPYISSGNPVPGTGSERQSDRAQSDCKDGLLFRVSYEKSIGSTNVSYRCRI